MKPPTQKTPDVVRDAYLDLLCGMITREIAPDRLLELQPYEATWRRRVVDVVQGLLARRGLVMARRASRSVVVPWATSAETMLGFDRINDLRDCIETVLLEGVEGDLFEAGVWRGGGVILMRAMLAAYSDEERIVWAADSFRGPPPPSAKQDIGFDFHRQPSFRASLETVRGNVRRYGLSEDRIRYVDGWFEDTLPALEVHRIGVLQIGVDLFSATTTALRALYPRVSSGGFVLVDGYRSEDLVRRAVDAFRAEHGIHEPLTNDPLDRACWRRS